MTPAKTIKPQPGPQTAFLSSRADIVVYGGAAGGGKTFSLLMEPLRHVRVNNFNGVIFRRETPQIKNPDGLWDESRKIYPLVRGEGYRSLLEWRFGDRTSIIKFAHLEKEETVESWQGAQICYLGFDELPHFEASQFWYMLSRNRSTCGVKPYVRASCNPDPDSWVADLIDWWIGEDGYPIPERSGVLRYLMRIEDDIRWYDSKEEAYLDNKEFLDRMAQHGVNPYSLIKSFTFIPSSIYDNKILLEKDPAYLANLMLQGTVAQAQLLDGNWKIKAGAGLVFNRSALRVVESHQLPTKFEMVVRFWDLAATKKQVVGKKNDPDWTAGVCIGMTDKGRFYVLDVDRFREAPAERDARMLAVATSDKELYENYVVAWEGQPAAAGKSLDDQLADLFAGFTFVAVPARGDKVLRASPAASSAKAGKFFVLKAAWTEAYIKELHSFPDGKKDDQVDGTSGAHFVLTDSELLKLIFSAFLDDYAMDAADRVGHVLDTYPVESQIVWSIADDPTGCVLTIASLTLSGLVQIREQLHEADIDKAIATALGQGGKPKWCAVTSGAYRMQLQRERIAVRSRLGSIDDQIGAVNALLAEQRGALRRVTIDPSCEQLRRELATARRNRNGRIPTDDILSARAFCALLWQIRLKRWRQ